MHAIRGLAQARILAKIDFQLDWMAPCCMYKKQTQFSLHTKQWKLFPDSIRMILMIHRWCKYREYANVTAQM